MLDCFDLPCGGRDQHRINPTLSLFSPFRPQRIASERGEKGGKGGGGQDGNSPLKRLPASRMKYIEDSGGKEPSPMALKEELHSSQAPGPSHGGFSSLLQFVHTKLGQYVASAEEGQGADEARLQPEGSPR